MARKANIKAKITKTVEEKQIGSEPDVGSKIGSFEILKFYNSYNYFYGKDDAKQFLLDWLKNENHELTKIIEKVPTNDIPTTVGWIARMLIRKCELPHSTLDFFNTNIQRLSSYIKQSSNEKVNELKPATKENQFIAELEAEYDSILLGNKPSIDINSWLQNNNVPLYQMKEIADYYEPMIEEIDFVQKSKDINSCLNRDQAKVMKQWLTSIINAVASINDNRKRQRKPRTVKAKKPDQILKNFVYKKECSDLNIASINPEKILGSTALYVYNTKTRTLFKFIAEDGKKLSVNRTSIINYDTNKSLSKTIRKPADIIPPLLKQTKRESQKSFDVVKTKEKTVTTSRLNDQCILISSFV